MPDKSITRAEFATVTYKFLEKLGKIEQGTDVKTQLKDIEGHWLKSILRLWLQRIYKGYPDETFRLRQVLRGRNL